MRIVFFGTPDFAVPFLQSLLNDADFDVAAVVTQTDKPIGRKHVLTAPPVKRLAIKYQVSVLQPKTLKSDEIVQTLRDVRADIFVVVAYGKLIPKSVLDLPRLGCVNVHPSLLPKYRGPSPMQWAIREGDRETGITIMKLDEGMDTGPILAQTRLLVDPTETLVTLMQKIHKIGPAFLIKSLKAYATQAIKPVAQDDAKATSTRLLTREDGEIDWREPAESIDRRLRAYVPWPGVWTNWNRTKKPLRIKIIRAELSEKKLAPGQVLAGPDGLSIGTGSTAIRVIEVQVEGASAMSAAEFIRGYSDVSGATLG